MVFLLLYVCVCPAGSISAPKSENCPSPALGLGGVAVAFFESAAGVLGWLLVPFVAMACAENVLAKLVVRRLNSNSSKISVTAATSGALI